MSDTIFNDLARRLIEDLARRTIEASPNGNLLGARPEALRTIISDPSLACLNDYELLIAAATAAVHLRRSWWPS